MLSESRGWGKMFQKNLHDFNFEKLFFQTIIHTLICCIFCGINFLLAESVNQIIIVITAFCNRIAEKYILLLPGGYAFKLSKDLSYLYFLKNLQRRYYTLNYLRGKKAN